MSPRTQVPVTERSVSSADGTTIGFQTMGAGPGVIVVGGALRTASDYRPVASALARSCTVHVVDRRGRGASGPQGPGYTLRKEAEDLLAVQAETGARLAFGHSYGGRAILETARLFQAFDRIALYEPGVPGTRMPTGWLDPYRERLAASDPYGAFVHLIRGSGGAPAFMEKMPYWYLRTVMRVGFRGRAWQRMRPLLQANLTEHEQLAAQQRQLPAYAAITAPVLLLCGSRAPSWSRADLEDFRDTLPNATLEILARLNHFALEGKSAPVVAERAAAFLLGCRDRVGEAAHLL